MLQVVRDAADLLVAGGLSWCLLGLEVQVFVLPLCESMFLVPSSWLADPMIDLGFPRRGRGYGSVI